MYGKYGEERFPQLIIDEEALRQNVRYFADLCGAKGIDLAGVVKGASGLPATIRAFADGGAAQIASSRLEQLENVKKLGIDKPTMLLRVPMLSEIEDVIRIADISLNSEAVVLKALNEEAGRQGKKHQVLLMADMGDLREGYWDKDELAQVALMVDRELTNLELIGIGTNVGCWGSIYPDRPKLDELVAVAEKVEAVIGRELRYISGGATSSFMRVMDGDIPPRINHLRCGEGVLLARDFDVLYHLDTSMFRRDVFKLRAEVIEVREKPSHPVGTIGFDAFGRQPEYVDRGIRRRALVAVGKVDIGDQTEIFPTEEGIEILGGSSDHTILDVTDYKGSLEVGDVLEFDINYGSLIYLSMSPNVTVVVKN
ncbi:MAG: alanine/ornithine racemase family PLP-dependent enzyme [Eubacterium sp.]|nr:alanine/ornithine racemase family PLP-dependent enzyme [Eubacterium sp.]